MRHPRELDAERIRLALGSFDDERRPVLALVTDVAARLLKTEAEVIRLKSYRKIDDEAAASLIHETRERALRAEAEVAALKDALIEIYNCYDKGGNPSEEAYAAIDAARAALKEGTK